MSEADDMSHCKSNDDKQEAEAVTSVTLSSTRQRTLTEKGIDWSLAQSFNICQELHPTVFHNHKRKENEQRDNGNKDDNKQESKEINQGNEVCGLTGAGNVEGTMSIVPVRVKMRGESQCISTYAFLDNGSSATFCAEGLMRRLHARGRKSKISLRTMCDDRIVDT